jgi:hypothetical protein
VEGTTCRGRRAERPHDDRDDRPRRRAGGDPGIPQAFAGGAAREIRFRRGSSARCAAWTAARAARERRARSAAEALRRAGTRVRFSGSIHVPEDEICFFTFEAASGREAALVSQRAGLEPLRVVEAR